MITNLVDLVLLLLFLHFVDVVHAVLVDVSRRPPIVAWRREIGDARVISRRSSDVVGLVERRYRQNQIGTVGDHHVRHLLTDDQRKDTEIIS